MNSAIYPSLAVIAAIGAQRSGLVAATRHFVMSTANTDTTKVPLPSEQYDMGKITKWAVGVGGLSITFLILGSGDGALSDTIGALAALTAASLFALSGGDLWKSISGTAPTSSASPQAAAPSYPVAP